MSIFYNNSTNIILQLKKPMIYFVYSKFSALLTINIEKLKVLLITKLQFFILFITTFLCKKELFY